MRTPENPAPTFEEVYRENFNVIAGFAEKRGALGAGEDVAQETMSRLFCQEKFDTINARPWLVTTAGRIVIDLHRRSQKRPQTVDFDWMTEQEAACSDQTGRVHAGIIARQALDFMNPDQRDVIELVVMKDLSISEAAKILSIPEGTVKTRKFYGLLAARSALEEMGIHSAD